MPPNSPGIAEVIQRIKQEIESLSAKQSEAVKWAVYSGMSGESAREYDKREDHIRELSRELDTLQKRYDQQES